MRIAVLPPFPDGPAFAVENFLQLGALRELLSDHELVRVDNATQARGDFDLRVCVGARWLEDGFWDEWLVGKPAPCLALGFYAPNGFEWSSRTTEKLKAFAHAGGISVVDNASFQKAKEILSASDLSLGGSTALFSHAQGFALAKGGKVFLAGTSDPAFSGKHTRALNRLSRRFYRRLNQKGRALFFAHTPAEFLFGALPGRNTLFAPADPQLHLMALASASFVVGFHPTALAAAVACGVPAVLLGSDPLSRSTVETAGIPFLEINPNTDPTELEHRVEEVVRKYPWETIREKSGRLKDALLDHLKETGLKPKTAPRAVAKAEPSKKVFHVAHVLGHEDVALFAGLYENLLADPTCQVLHHVLALDRQVESTLQKAYTGRSVYLYRPSEVWNRNEITPLLAPAATRRFLLKPRFLSVLAQKCQGPVLYCEPRLYFHEPPSQLIGALGDAHTLLFPRWSDTTCEPHDSSVFDTGMMLVTPASEPLLAWWSEMSRCAVEKTLSLALADEPGFLAQAPILFEGVRVYRAADENVSPEARRLLDLRSSEWAGESARLADGRRVRSLQWLGEDPSGHFEVKAVWDQLCHFFANLPALAPTDALAGEILAQQKVHWEDLRLFLRAQTLFSRHFPWFAHPPTRLGLRFFVSGRGRWIGRLLGELASLTRPLSRGLAKSLLDADADWIREQRRQVFAPFPSSRDEDSTPSVTRHAASA